VCIECQQITRLETKMLLIVSSSSNNQLIAQHSKHSTSETHYKDTSRKPANDCMQSTSSVVVRRSRNTVCVWWTGQQTSTELLLHKSVTLSTADHTTSRHSADHTLLCHSTLVQCRSHNVVSQCRSRTVVSQCTCAVQTTQRVVTSSCNSADHTTSCHSTVVQHITCY